MSAAATAASSDHLDSYRHACKVHAIHYAWLPSSQTYPLRIPLNLQQLCADGLSCAISIKLSSSPLPQVEAKYPALLFKQQLDAFVQKIFPMLRDNVKKEITPQLAACIHAPRAVTTRSRRGAPPPQAGDSGTSPGESACIRSTCKPYGQTALVTS